MSSPKTPLALSRAAAYAAASVAEKPAVEPLRLDGYKEGAVLLGSGGYGDTFRASTSSTSSSSSAKTVIVKRLQSHVSLGLIQIEVGILAYIQSHCSPYFTCLVEHKRDRQDRSYIILEFLGNYITLGEFRTRQTYTIAPALGLKEAVEALIYDARAPLRRLWDNMQDAVSALHAVGVVHYDLKPENMMIDIDTLHVRLIDFGSACIIRPTKGTEPPKYVLCGPDHMKISTVQYYSPEEVFPEGIDRLMVLRLAIENTLSASSSVDELARTIQAALTRSPQRPIRHPGSAAEFKALAEQFPKATTALTEEDLQKLLDAPSPPQQLGFHPYTSSEPGQDHRLYALDIWRTALSYLEFLMGDLLFVLLWDQEVDRIAYAAGAKPTNSDELEAEREAFMKWRYKMEPGIDHNLNAYSNALAVLPDFDVLGYVMDHFAAAGKWLLQDANADLCASLRAALQYDPRRRMFQIVDAPLRIQGYEMTQRLQSSGYAQCFLARHLESGATLSVKRYPKATPKDIPARAIQVLRYMQQSCQSFTQCLAGDMRDEKTGEQYVLFQLPSNQSHVSLRECIAAIPYKETDPPRAEIVLKNMIGALQALHSSGVIHRRITAESVLIDTSTLDIRIVGFDDACILPSDAKAIGYSDYLCPFPQKPFGVSETALSYEDSYLAPEQLLGEFLPKSRIDYARIDIWALGISFASLLFVEDMPMNRLLAEFRKANPGVPKSDREALAVMLKSEAYVNILAVMAALYPQAQKWLRANPDVASSLSFMLNRDPRLRALDPTTSSSGASHTKEEVREASCVIS